MTVATSGFTANEIRMFDLRVTPIRLPYDGSGIALTESFAKSPYFTFPFHSEIQCQQGWVIPNMRFKRFLKTRFKQVLYFLKQGLAE